MAYLHPILLKIRADGVDSILGPEMVAKKTSGSYLVGGPMLTVTSLERGLLY